MNQQTELIITDLLVIEHDQNRDTSFVVSVLIHKTGGGEGVAYLREGTYFKFWSIGVALIQRGRLFEGGC